MCRALPGSEYYGGSAPSRPDRPTVGPACDRAGGVVPGQDRNGSRVHVSFDRRSRSPAIPPRHRHDYPAALRRGLPGRHIAIARKVPHPQSKTGTHRIQPRSARFELVTSKEASTPVPRVLLSVSLAGPAPSGSADTSRLCQGRLPPFPAPPGSGCPQLQPPCCDRAAVASFHRHSNNSRFTAHLWLSSSRSRCGRLVEGAVAKHGEEDVDAASGERDEGGDVVFAFSCGVGGADASGAGVRLGTSAGERSGAGLTKFT